MDQLKALILKAKSENPDFGEPWQADAFVTALTLSHEGHYTWGLWVNRFAQIIKAFPQQAKESSEDAYYRQWLACLESVLSEESLLQKSEIIHREEKWRQAYLKTPHGSPVELKRAEEPGEILHHDHHHHDHHHHHGPSHECESGTHGIGSVAKPLCVFKSGIRVDSLA